MKKNKLNEALGDELYFFTNNLLIKSNKHLTEIVSCIDVPGINAAINKITKHFLAAVKDTYLLKIMDDLNFHNGAEYNGRILKKYYGSFSIVYALYVGFIKIVISEILLYRTYYIKIISVNDYFNDDKIKLIIDSYFSLAPEFRFLIKWKMKFEHKRKTGSSNYKTAYLFPAISEIRNSNNNCTLRQALVLLENEMPGVLDESIEKFNIKIKQAIKLEKINNDNKNKQVRIKKVFSADKAIEDKARALESQIKSDYSRYCKKSTSLKLVVSR